MPWVLGPWEQRDVGLGEPCWCGPPEATCSIDLRSLPNHTMAGAGLFEVPQGWRGGPEFVALGRAGDVVTGRDVATWRQLTGATGVQPGTVSDLLWQTLTVAADPDGQNGPRPAMPDRRGLVRIDCGDIVRSARVDVGRAEWAASLDLMRKQYRVLRERARAGEMVTQHGVDFDYHRKQLGIWGRKLGIAAPQDVLIPADLPRETPLPHRTPVTESFDKADSSGWDADLTWTTVVGTFETVSNRARGVASAGLYCAHSDTALSGVDLYSQCEIYFSSHSSADYAAPSARHPASATNTQYWIRHFNTNNGQTYKYVGGSLTNIGTNTTSTSMTSVLVSRLECEGTAIRRIYNGTTENDIPDGSIDGVIVGGAYGGIRGRRFSASLFYENDNWEGDGLAAGPVSAYYRHMMTLGVG